MPEGPEIRRAADRIARILVGEELDAVRLHIPRLRKYESSLDGRTVAAVETRGKAMLTRFDNGLNLYSHNQLYGRWYTMRRPRLPRTNRQLRVELHTDANSALLYSATDIDILRDEDIDAHPFLARIGPDLLSPELTYGEIGERLRSKTFRDRSCGALYLDQGFIAGLGNYLRSEILFLARVHPLRRPAELSDREVANLARETLRVAKRSYRTGGVTLLPTLAKELKGTGRGFERRRFYVYGRENRPCRICGHPVLKTALSSRNVFSCESCQGV